MEPDFLKCKCIHCNQSIEFPKEYSETVIDCPHCGKKTKLNVPYTGPKPDFIIAPRPREPINYTRWLIAATCIVVIAFVFFGATRPDSPPEPDKPRPTAGISVGDDFVMLQNKDSFDWNGLTVAINKPYTGCHYRLAFLKSGGTTIIRLKDFADDDGKRFNADANIVKSVWIGGGKFDYNGYDNTK